MAISNALTPNVKAVSLNTGSVFITGGIATGTAAIIADVKKNVGPVGNGSVYLSNNGTGEVWVLVSGVWTELTIN